MEVKRGGGTPLCACDGVQVCGPLTAWEVGSGMVDGRQTVVDCQRVGGAWWGHASIVPAVKVRSTCRLKCVRGYATLKRVRRLSGSGCAGFHSFVRVRGGAAHATWTLLVRHHRRGGAAVRDFPAAPRVRAPSVTNAAILDSARPSVPLRPSARSETAPSSPSATRAHDVLAPSRLAPAASAAASAQLGARCA